MSKEPRVSPRSSLPAKAGGRGKVRCVHAAGRRSPMIATTGAGRWWCRAAATADETEDGN